MIPPRSEEPTPAQKRILQLIAQGYTDRMAGIELGLSKETVRTQVGMLRERMHVKTRSEAVAKGIRSGWID